MQVSNFVPTVNEAAATYKGKYGLIMNGNMSRENILVVSHAMYIMLCKATYCIACVA